VLANPPYSIKQWNREAWQSDPWGRNFLGTPPQGRADYAFFQHILKSLDKGGRCAILFPHGVLFRKEEAEMRQKLVDADLVDCVLGLGPNLFYNSPMEACIVICRMNKPVERRGRVQFINAVDEVTRERSMSYLKPEHQQRIADAYHAFADVDGFAKVATLNEIHSNDGNLSIPLYVRRIDMREKGVSEAKGDYSAADGLKTAVKDWEESSDTLNEAISGLLKTLG
jgi:type I restriction enzyme M protein